MGNRLREYGFTSPFRAHVKGSNYDASLADLSGGAINQFLTDVSTYNTIIRDYGLTSQIEYKQPNGSWGTAVPPKPTQRVMYQPGSSPSGTTYSAERYTLDNNPNAKGEQINLMPEYRWRISGDIEGANQALRDAGLQGSYTQPDGRTINTGGSFTAIVPGKSVTLTTPLSGYGGVQRAGTAYVDSADPLGAGIGGSHSAIDRAYNGATAPQYYTLPNRPFGTGTTIDAMSDQSYGTYYVKRVADEVFSNPNLGSVIYNPTGFRAALEATPQISNQIGTYFDNTADFWNKRDNDGGGPLGVIAKGLAGVAQFASMATGLNALVTGLGSLVGGAGLQGAFNAALNTAGAMPDIGSVIGGAAGSATAGNLANIAIGGIIGGEAGGLPGALLGAGGAAIGAGIDQAGGIREFIRDPFGNITGAIGLGGEVLSGAQLAAMEAAGQINLGSTAQNLAGGVPDYSMEVIGGASNLLGGGTGSSLGGTIGSAIGGNLAGGSVISAPGNVNFTGSYVDPTTGQVVEQYEVIAESGDTTQAGGGMGSSAGGGAGSAIGDMLGGGGASTGPSSPGGLLDGNVTPGTPGNPSGSIQTTAPGTTPTAGTGTGQTGVIGGPGGISPDGMPIGIPGVDAPYPPGSYQGQIGAVDGVVGGDPFGSIGTSGTQPGGQYDDSKFDLVGNLIPSLGPWDFTGATSGPGTPNATGLLDTGTGPTGTGPGGNGPGGDGPGGDGLGGDGLGGGNNFGGFDYSGLLGGMTPGGMGDPVSFLTPRAYGTKKKGPASFYGKLQAPKKRKGITVRRA